MPRWMARIRFLLSPDRTTAPGCAGLSGVRAPSPQLFGTIKGNTSTRYQVSDGPSRVRHATRRLDTSSQMSLAHVMVRWRFVDEREGGGRGNGQHVFDIVSDPRATGPRVQPHRPTKVV